MGRRVSIESVLKPEDFDHVWDYLEQKFGYGKSWRKECYDYVFGKHDYNSGPVWYFIFFCRMRLDPLLNAALCRNEHHPTFIGILKWMFRHRLTEMQ